MTAVGPVSDHPIGSHGPALAPTPRDCASTHRRENSHVLSQVTALGPEGDAHRQIFDCLRSCATRQGWQSSRSYEPDSQLGFLWGGMTMGMLLSLPLLLAGLSLVWTALRRPCMRAV